MDKLALNGGLMLLLCSITLALLCAELCVAVKKGRLYARGVINGACKAIIITAASALAGFLIGLIPLDGVWVPVVFCTALVLVAAIVLLFYISGKRKAVRTATANALRKSAGGVAAVRHAKGWLYGACFTLLIATAVMLAVRSQDYYLAVVPVAIVAVCLLLHGILPWRIWYAIATLATVAFFINILYVDIISPKLLSLKMDAPAVAIAAMLAASGVTLALKKE